MGEIAAILHWPPSVLEAMEIEELSRWHTIAVATWNRMQSGKD